jgi:hypothetical protein
VLGRGVPGAALVGDPARGGPEVDDDAVASGEQGRQQRLGHPLQPDHVDLVHRAPVVRVRLDDRVRADGRARVVDEDVEAVADHGAEPLDVGGVGDVAAHRGPADLLGECADAVLAPRGAEHVESLGGEPSGGGCADAAARSGDDGRAGALRCHSAIVTPSSVVITGYLRRATPSREEQP